MTGIAADMKVGQIAAEYPLSTRVFARHGIDYCCGGGKPLASVCEKKGLDSTTLLAEIKKELTAPGNGVADWNSAALGDLIDHILSAYHQPLYEELPRLEAMARKVDRVHGERDARLADILAVYLTLKSELDSHMPKEEQILFPMIRAGEGGLAKGPISVMLHEHYVAADCLRKLSELTDAYTVPEGACNTWRALWHGLAALETSLHEHIHLENNILFPRALAS